MEEAGGFTVEKMAEQFEALYLKLLSKRGTY